MAEKPKENIPFPCSTDPSAFILEQSRRKYPGRTFFIMSQGPDGVVDIATNILPKDVKHFLKVCLADLEANGMEKRPVPKI